MTGFERECPLLRFAGKENHVCDRFGEKVSEEQVQSALAGLEADFLLVSCEDGAYTLCIESSASDVDLLAVGEHLERSLRDNVHYRYCRDLGQPAPVRVFRIARHGQVDYLAARKRAVSDWATSNRSCCSPMTDGPRSSQVGW